MICNHGECEADISHMMGDSIEAHSAVIVLQKVDRTGYSFYQCEDGQEHQFVTYQHYHCSHGHMKTGLIACLNEHYTEDLLHGIPSGGGTTIMHKIVLRSNLQCKLCQAPLTDQAYRFCLTLCTPYNAIPDDSHNQLGEWCCNIEHARQSALTIVENL